MTDAGLWAFALEIWRRPGVETAMLELQDRYGQCVPYLLWALWLRASGRCIDATTLAAGAALARTWQDGAIAPLRELRRRLPALQADEPQAWLRQAVRALELDAERRLLEKLEAVGPAVVAGQPVELGDAIRSWGGSAPPAVVERLIAVAV